MRIALAQLNLNVGDITGNLQKLIHSAKRARDQLAADVIVYPELSITGYPPEDLLLRQAFIASTHRALDSLRAEVAGIHMVVGYPEQTSDGLRNVCSIIRDGQILGAYAKQHLPNYGVFDERRYFSPGETPCVINLFGIPTAIIICEDLWHPAPLKQAIAHGAKLLISLNASPFEVKKAAERRALLTRCATEANIPIVYVNNVGGQDELVFDGGSTVVNAEGQICLHAGFFREALPTIDMEYSQEKVQVTPTIVLDPPSEEERIYECLVLGVRDYIEKNGFPGILLGLSGGVDSALVVAIAVDALGKDRVHTVLLPSRYTSEISLEDAITLANNLGVRHDIISIEPSFQSFLESLAPSFAGKKPDITEENLQARCRSNILMALSNKTGKMVLTTSNRSEIAMGYGTLYGDMAGGLCVLKDIPKTLVYRLVEYRNRIQPIIPERIITRPPTAELAPNQKDEDTLPSYPVLDKILELYIEQEQSIAEIIAAGFSEDMVINVAQAITRNEYKRRQAPIGIRINHKAFGRDRRYPITCRDGELQERAAQVERPESMIA